MSVEEMIKEGIVSAGNEAVANNGCKFAGRSMPW
jgi:hypothetical protein